MAVMRLRKRFVETETHVVGQFCVPPLVMPVRASLHGDIACGLVEEVQLRQFVVGESFDSLDQRREDDGTLGC